MEERTRAEGSEDVTGLTTDERQLLEFAKLRWKYPGARDTAILEQFRISPTIYFSRLNRLLDDPRALAAEPQLVRQLLRARDARRAQRSKARIAGCHR